MNSSPILAATRRLTMTSSTLTVGLPLAFLWALHAAANYVPGTGYVRLPILFGMAAACLVWRLSGRAARPRHMNNSFVTVGLSALFTAATLSTILNWNTEEVASTYLFVFLSGGATFVALSGVTCTVAALDVALVGLVAGALFPLVGGLLAFYSEWGAPNATTTIAAWQSLARMSSYTDATFGNRGNTAGFVLIVTPMLLAVLFDRRKRLVLRAFCAATLVPIAINLMILQIRAAFITLFVAFIVIWAFEFGVRRLPLMMGMLIVAWLLLFKFQPDAGLMMSERILPAITVDTEADESIRGRVAAIQEGVGLARRNWLFGIGPGAAQTVHSLQAAHQFNVQQWMETGIIGLVGSMLLSIGVLVSLLRTLVRGRGDEVNDTRFLLLIGPAAFVTYAVIANAAFNNGSVNTWTVLIMSMLALAPRFDTNSGRERGFKLRRLWPGVPALDDNSDGTQPQHDGGVAANRWRHIPGRMPAPLDRGSKDDRSICE
jgi:O-antigen ligase